MYENLTEEERKSQLEILRNSYEMYERSKEETLKKRNGKKDKAGNPVYSEKSTKDTIQLMETMQKDIVEKYLAMGGKEEELVVKKKRSNNRKAILEKIEAENKKDEMEEYMKSISENFKKNKIVKEEPKENQIKKGYNLTGNKVNYDTVNLPSKGECYKNKMKEIMVSHLCAYDENLIMSPNLYRNGTFLDHILKNKIVDDIDADDLVQGDRDAILIWLRASGYGNEYPIDVTDEKTNKVFRANVDLSKLNYKKFTLKGDEDGYFDFELPISKDKVKFKFLTNGDIKKLDAIREAENNQIKINKFRNGIKDLKDSITDNNLLSDNDIELLNNDIENLENKFNESYDKDAETLYTHDLTNRLIMSTVSINGNSDENFIADYILNMNVKDAKAYRQYIIDNEPGIDYNIQIERPSSLGGGYINTFLQLDQFIFISAL